MGEDNRQETALEKALRMFRLPEYFSVEVLPGRVNIMHIPTGKGIAIDPAHYASVAAALISFGAAITQEAETDDDRWKADLPRHHETDRVTLDLTTVAIDTRRMDHVLGTPEEHPDARHVPAYAVRIDGNLSGHILAMAERKFILAVPSLNPDRSIHRSFEAAVQRLSMLVKHPAISDVA